MTSDEWFKAIHGLEKIFGFKVDCPRCRSWQILFKDNQKTVLLKCLNCGLQLKILKQSIVKHSGMKLPMPIMN